MKLTANENVLRVALVVFSIIFGILSVSLICLGVVYIDELWWPRRYVGLDFLELPTMLIILGSLSLLMSLVGCYCAKSYNRKLLLVFGGILLTILCLELTIAVIAFINFDEHAERNTKTLLKMQEQLNSADDDHVIFKQVEEHYQCCGVTGTEDRCNLTAGTNEINLPSELRGCASIVDATVQTIALEAGYFSAVLSLLQIVEIGYVCLIQNF